MENDGTLFPMEIKKTASPGSQLTHIFRVLDSSEMRKGTGGRTVYGGKTRRV